MTAGQSTWKSVSSVVASCSAEMGRSVSTRTSATGAPVASATATLTSAFSAIRTRTRRSVAPAECSATSFQANGSRLPCSVVRAGSRPVACMAASSSAGCRPKSAGSVPLPSGIRTSAYAYSPATQARWSAWNAGP